MRTSLGNFLLGLVLGFLLMVLESATARSQPYPIGTGLTCDTAAQAESFVRAFQGNTAAALAQVNAEAGKADACAVSTVAYILGEKKGEARNKEGTFDVVEIVVIGGLAANGKMSPTAPTIQYTLFRTKGQEI